MNNIHATLISYNNNGILFIGKSGTGKSDLALRMIMQNNALLVSDDYVNLEVVDNHLYGTAPQEIAGKMEVRGLGIMPFNNKSREKITLCVELLEKREDVERLPMPEYCDFLGISVPKIKLYAFDCSTSCKIIAKISGIIS